jgi:hypothetical protein
MCRAIDQPQPGAFGGVVGEPSPPRLLLGELCYAGEDTSIRLDQSGEPALIEHPPDDLVGRHHLQRLAYGSQERAGAHEPNRVEAVGVGQLDGDELGVGHCSASGQPRQSRS